MTAAPRPTIRILLEKLARDDQNVEFCRYMDLRLTRMGRASAAENLLSKLHDRGFVIWDGDVYDTRITEAGRAYLKTLEER